jgi:uncharacterized protein YggT (Ycf19 family)
MGLIDFTYFILNVAGLLLWLNWRSVRLDPFTRTTPATLGGTIRRAEPHKLKRWHFLVALIALIVVRALFYQQVGPGLNWTPKLNLVFVTPAFRVNVFAHELLFSVLSFLRALLVFYFWLLAIAAINGPSADPDPLQKMLLLLLGPSGRWPRLLQIFFLPLFAAALWLAFHPLLTRMDVTNHVQSIPHLVGQGLLIGAGLILSLKYLLPAFLFVHLAASYVYFGNSPVFDFVNTTTRNILAPLRPLPLQYGKVDLSPVAGLLLIGLLFYQVPWLTIPWWIERLLEKNNLILWPN